MKHVQPAEKKIMETFDERAKLKAEIEEMVRDARAQRRLGWFSVEEKTLERIKQKRLLLESLESTTPASDHPRHTQGEVLMKFLNSDAVEIYSITPQHTTICTLTCFDSNGKRIWSYEELKANSERIVKACNLLTYLENTTCESLETEFLLKQA